MNMTNPELKKLFKEALIEVLETRPEFLRDAFIEAIEDTALLKAIKVGDKDELVSYEELSKVMERKIEDSK